MANYKSDIPAIEEKKGVDRERVRGGEIIHTPAGQDEARRQRNIFDSQTPAPHTPVNTTKNPSSPFPIEPRRRQLSTEASSKKTGGAAIFIGLILAFFFFASQFETHSPSPVQKTAPGGSQVTAPNPSPPTAELPVIQNPLPAPPAPPIAQPALSVDWFFATPFRLEMGDPLTWVLRWQPIDANELATVETFVISLDGPQNRALVSFRTYVRPGETRLSLYLPSDIAPGQYALDTISLTGGRERREERVSFMLVPRGNPVASDAAPHRAEVTSPNAKEVAPTSPTAPMAPGVNDDIYRGS